MAKANPFRFSTKYQDDESDLLYYGYRYYNASTGRWLSRDRLGEVVAQGSGPGRKPQSWKLYPRNTNPLYVAMENNELDNIDPSGLNVYKVQYRSSICCLDHRVVVGDTGTNGVCYLMDYWGDAGICCGTKLEPAKNGRIHTRFIQRSASDVVAELKTKPRGQVSGIVYTDPSVDRSLAAEAGQNDGQSSTYVILWNDCNTFANSWLHEAERQETPPSPPPYSLPPWAGF